MGGDRRFEQLRETRQEFFDHKDSNHRLALERRVVRKLLPKYLRDDHEDRFKEEFLSFCWLNQRRELPFTLTLAEPLRLCVFPGFLRATSKRGPWVAWRKLHRLHYSDNDPSSYLLPLAVAFEAGGADESADLMVVHNWTEREVKETVKIKCTFDEFNLCLETLDDLAKRLYAP